MQGKAEPWQNRFWQKVNKKSEQECWEWQAAKTARGYGQLNVEGIMRYAHRLSYFLHNEVDTFDLVVMHSCNNPSCVNPNHLVLGTQKQNLQQMYREKRDDNRNRIGIHNKNCSFSESEVREIKQLLAEGKFSQRKIAKMYGVTSSTISNISLGKTWSHIL